MADSAEEVERLLEEADNLIDEEQDEEALDKFQEAWAMLPEPKDDQESAVRILAGIIDCQFYLGDWESCRTSVQHSFRCGADVSNPFLRLRLGQALYELGDEQEASNWLAPAYLSEGRELFAAEDPKYLNFFHSKLQPPPGGWPEGW